MTSVASSTLPAPPPATPRAGALMTRAALLASIAMVCLADSFWNYALEMRFNLFRTSTVLVFLIAGTGATFCLALAMQSLIVLLRSPGLSLPFRFLLQAANRLLLLFQLLATGLFLLGLGVLIFGGNVPGTHHAVLHPGWNPPVEEADEPLPATIRTRAGGLFRSIAPSVP